MPPSPSPLPREPADPAPTEAMLREGAELMFFGYRSFTSDPDRILDERNYGRAHHRALHFIGRRPGLTVADLLDILHVTKQSLSRVLKPLIDHGLVEQKVGETDRRQRMLYLTAEGQAFEERLSAPQRQRLTRAFMDAGPEAVAGFRAVLTAIMEPEERREALAHFAGADRR